MIEKRAYLRLDRHVDEGHPTVSAIAPLVCFSITLTIAVLLRIISTFDILAARCVATDEFWFTPSGGNWPLIASTMLVLFLLFVWNIFIAFDDWKRSAGARIMVVVNALAIAAMLYFVAAVQGSATFSYNSRTGIYDDFLIRPFGLASPYTDSECAAMQRFAGRWRIVERHIGLHELDIPAQWIELNPWGYVYAQDASWSEPYAEKWSPPQMSHSDDDRWRYGELFGVLWDFELRNDTLVLTTPEDWLEHEWQRSRIVLQLEALARPTN